MNPKRSHHIKTNRKSALLGRLAGCVMWLFSKTLRVSVVDEAGVGDPTRLREPVIYVLWHNRIFFLPPIWQRWCGRHRKCIVLTSASRDGDMVAKALAVFGFGAVRGSSSRRGAAALVGLKRALRDGLDTAITPDGPKGPIYKLQGGVVKLAESSQVPIVPMHASFSSAWRLKTWDRFVIPKPFSKVELRFGPPIRLERGLDTEALEAERQKLELMLVAGVDDA